jgi:hypothetical protein
VPLHEGHGPCPNLPLPRHNSHTSRVAGSGAGFMGASLLGMGGLNRLDRVGHRLRMCVKMLSEFLKSSANADLGKVQYFWLPRRAATRDR